MAEATGWREWRSHWTVVLPCFLAIMLVTAHNYSLGVMIGPLEEEFGWARAEISLPFMFIAIMALVAAPMIGTLVDKFGPRRIGLLGVALFCASLSCLSFANSNILSWWGLYLLVAVGALTMIPVVWLSVINSYFFASRGLALAVCLSGTGLGAAIWPNLANALVEGYGWRSAYVGLALIGFIVVFPIAWLLFREAPGADGRRSMRAQYALTSASARQQMRSVRYFKLGAVALIFALANGMLSQNMVPVLRSEGFNPATAAAIAGLFGIGSIAGRVVGGFLLDRIDGNKVGAISTLLPLITLAIFIGLEPSRLLAVIACLIMGFSVGAELDCCAYLVGRHFGTRNFGALFGMINGFLLFGTGMAPVIANLVYDQTRSYDLVMIGLVPIFLLTTILFLSLGSYRHLDPETGEPLAT